MRLDAAMRPLCTGRRKDGEPCRGPAIRGGSKCRMHAGGKKARAKAAARAEVLAWQMTDETVDAGQTLLRMLTVSARQERLYAWLLEQAHQELADKDAGSETGTSWQQWADLLVFDVRGEFGKVGESVRALVTQHAYWLAETARLSKLALDAGIAERIVRLEEGRAEQIVAVIRMALVALGLSPTDPRVGVAVTTALRQLEAGEAA